MCGSKLNHQGGRRFQSPCWVPIFDPQPNFRAHGHALDAECLNPARNSNRLHHDTEIGQPKGGLPFCKPACKRVSVNKHTHLFILCCKYYFKVLTTPIFFKLICQNNNRVCSCPGINRVPSKEDTHLGVTFLRVILPLRSVKGNQQGN